MKTSMETETSKKERKVTMSNKDEIQVREEIFEIVDRALLTTARIFSPLLNHDAENANASRQLYTNLVVDDIMEIIK